MLFSSAQMNMVTIPTSPGKRGLNALRNALMGPDNQNKQMPRTEETEQTGKGQTKPKHAPRYETLPKISISQKNIQHLYKNPPKPTN